MSNKKYGDGKTSTSHGDNVEYVASAHHPTDDISAPAHAHPPAPVSNDREPAPPLAHAPRPANDVPGQDNAAVLQDDTVLPIPVLSTVPVWTPDPAASAAHLPALAQEAGVDIAHDEVTTQAQAHDAGAAVDADPDPGPADTAPPANTQPPDTPAAAAPAPVPAQAPAQPPPPAEATGADEGMPARDEAAAHPPQPQHDDAPPALPAREQEARPSPAAAQVTISGARNTARHETPPESAPPQRRKAADRDNASPVHSMTGYAHHSADTALGRITIEVRAVNSRFLDLHFRLADELRPLEPYLRTAITSLVRRGKVECRMSLAKNRENGSPAVDPERLAELLALCRQIQTVVPDARPPTVADYLRWLHNPDTAPGANHDGADTLDDAALWRIVAPLAADCLDSFQQTRRQEGERLAQALNTVVGQMRKLGTVIQTHLPALRTAAENRLLERLQKALGELSLGIPPEETLARVRQEVSLMSLRDDITEEIDRLHIHLDAVQEALATGSPIGKRLDFLAQELNREANTIASKSASVHITNAAMTLKLLIEQLREQVQNLE